jgi:hypothetical protein
MNAATLGGAYQTQKDAVRDMLSALRLMRRAALEGLCEGEQGQLDAALERMRKLNGEQVLALLLSYRGLTRPFR